MPKQKYEREIAEILERLDRQGRGPMLPRRVNPSRRLRHFRSLLSTPAGWTSRTWLALSIGLPLLAVLVHRLAPAVGTLLVLAGILLFLSPLVLALAGMVRRDQRPLWRGRVIEMPSRGGSLAAGWRYRVWVWRQRWERWRSGRR
jgi:peptidoglycan/LPS O-acetylase OafA/YrhL